MVIVRENAGPIIRERRLAIGLKMYALARRVGCSETYLSDIERGIRVGSLDVLSRLCRELDLPEPQSALALAAEVERLQAIQS